MSGTTAVLLFLGRSFDLRGFADQFVIAPESMALKDWAGKTLTALQHHLMMAQDMDKNRK